MNQDVLSVSSLTTRYVIGLMCFKHEHLGHILAQIKEFYASLDRASSIVLLVSAGLFVLGLCLEVTVFMKRCTVTAFHHDKNYLLIITP